MLDRARADAQANAAALRERVEAMRAGVESRPACMCPACQTNRALADIERITKEGHHDA